MASETPGAFGYEVALLSTYTFLNFHKPLFTISYSMADYKYKQVILQYTFCLLNFFIEHSAVIACLSGFRAEQTGDLLVS